MRMLLFSLAWWSSKRQELTKTDDNLEKREPLCTINTLTMENSMGVPQKIKRRTTMLSSNSSSGKQNTNMRHICNLMPFAALFIIAKKRKLPKGSAEEWEAKELQCMHTVECYLAMGGGKFVLCNMDGLWGCYVKWQKAIKHIEKEKYCMVTTYLWNLKNKNKTNS